MTPPKAITIPLSDTSSLEMVYVEGVGKISSFYMGKHPVTNEQYVPFLNEKGNQEEGTTWVNLQGSYKAVRCGIKETENGFSCVKGLKQGQMHPHLTFYLEWSHMERWDEKVFSGIPPKPLKILNF